MGSNSWNDIGKEIRDTVQDAIDNRDFKQLNETISQVVNVAMQNVKNSVTEVKSVHEDTKKRYQEKYKHSTVTVPKAKNETLYAMRSKGLVSGVLAAILGFMFLAFCTFANIGLFIVAISVSSVSRTQAIQSIGFMTVIGLASLFVGLKGVGRIKRVQRFREYVRLMGTREYYAIQDFANQTNKSKSYVVKDLREMIKRRMFLKGCLDEQQTHLITSTRAYEQYQLMQEAANEKQEASQVVEQSNISAECREIINEGKSYIAHVRQCNDDIPGEEFSNKLARLEEIMKRIFEQVEKRPENAPELHKFMNYYLPTTTKLIDTYRDIDRQSIVGENIQNTKQEIEDTLDTINDAFENLLDRFFQDTAWDISSDISVMKTMLKQEGLTKDEMSIGNDR